MSNYITSVSVILNFLAAIVLGAALAGLLAGLMAWKGQFNPELMGTGWAFLRNDNVCIVEMHEGAGERFAACMEASKK